MHDELIGPTEAAAILGAYRTTVALLIDRGELDAFHERTKGSERTHRLRLRRSQVEALAARGDWRRRRLDRDK